MEYRLVRSDELYHYGVPGMRWGHRKGSTSLAGTGHRAMAGIYGINQRFYNKTGNKTLASMNAQARNRSLKKAAAADAKKANMSPEQKAAIRKQRVKRAAAVGGVAVAAALAVHGAKKYSALKSEMTQMNEGIKLGRGMVDRLHKNNDAFRGNNPMIKGSVSYLGNDFKYHTATRTANSFENLSVDTQQTYNRVRDYARAKKRYTGHY